MENINWFSVGVNFTFGVLFALILTGSVFVVFIVIFQWIFEYLDNIGG